MSARARAELRAAGIADPQLRAGYLLARRLNATHGKTYYLATLLLPPAKRPHVHALYGFARYADDIVDGLADGLEPRQRQRRFEDWSRGFATDLDRGESSQPLCRALLHTSRRFDLPASYFTDFLAAMREDLVVTSYPTFADLRRYMWGSAAVIGLQMLPILDRADRGTDWSELGDYAVRLGLAFQLTNFLRDVGEDLDRGRVYLPADDLARFGADPWRRVVDDPWRGAMAFEIARNRELYDLARTGVPMLPPASARCVGTALDLYSRILDRIEVRDYDVFSGRARVPTWRKALTAAGALLSPQGAVA